MERLGLPEGWLGRPAEPQATMGGPAAPPAGGRGMRGYEVMCFEWPDGQPGPTNVEITDYH